MGIILILRPLNQITSIYPQSLCTLALYKRIFNKIWERASDLVGVKDINMNLYDINMNLHAVTFCRPVAHECSGTKCNDKRQW